MERRRKYHLPDEKNSTYDIAKKLLGEGIEVGQMIVFSYWKKWSALGIIVSRGEYFSRFEKIIDLKKLNIEA